MGAIERRIPFWISCPDACISIDDDENPAIDLKYCKGCGVCVAECSRAVIYMQTG